MSALLILPNEIIAFILGQLSDEDLSLLRQVCKTTNAWASPRFNKRFSSRTVLFERRSLDSLDGVSRNPILASHVHHLAVGVDHLLPLDAFKAMNTPASGSTNESDICQVGDIDENAYCRRLAEQEQLIGGADMATFLVNVLNRLDQCNAFDVRFVGSDWAWERIARGVGMVPAQFLHLTNENSVEFVQRAISIAATAFSKSNVKVVELSIEIGFATNHVDCITSDMLPMGAPLAHLRNFKLSISPDDPRYSSNGKSWTSHIVQFLQKLPQLTDLYLDFDGADDQTRFSELSKELQIPKLEAFAVTNTCCSSMDLAFFFLRHQRTLEQIDLAQIMLSDEDYNHGWYWLCQVIRDSVPNVHSFSLEYTEVLWDYTDGGAQSLNDIFNQISIR